MHLLVKYLSLHFVYFTASACKTTYEMLSANLSKCLIVTSENFMKFEIAHPDVWQQLNPVPQRAKFVGFHITDRVLLHMASWCPYLLTMDLTGCSEITNKGLAGLKGRCPGLVWMDLTGCDKITDTGVASLADACPALVKICFAWCSEITHAGLARLATGCPGIKEVDITGCELVSPVEEYELPGQWNLIRRARSKRLRSTTQH